MEETLTEAAIRAHLCSMVFGRLLRVEPRLSSTNVLARELATAGAPEGTAVVAAEQTAGRGSKGRSFFSPAGGVYLSLVLRPAETADAGRITSCAAVAVARAIERLCPLTVGIKWVNDLYVGGKKVAGILTESAYASDGGMLYAVLGIGINVAAASFPPELREIATSLGNEGCAVERAALIAAVLEEWERAYATMAGGAFLTESRRRSVVLGRTVTVSRGPEAFEATATAITDDGHLLVRRPDGTETLLTAGEVTLRL